MKRFLFFILALSLVLQTPVSLFADPGSSDDVGAKIEALEKQVSSLQGQLSDLKQQLSTQATQTKELKQQVYERVPSPPAAHETTAAEGPKLNIGGEINLRYRQNMEKRGAKPGFELYEVELFLDSAVNKNGAFFVELPIMHSNKPDLGNAWVDFHSEDELAATGSTGLMIGHFMPWFGYYGYDDNQSWIYGGRTTTNTTLVRGTAIDQQIIRDRQLGIGANLKLGQWLLTNQVFNGAGPYIVAGGTDNDNRKDYVGRLQYTLPEDLGVVGTGFWWAPKTKGAATNSAGTQYQSGGKTHVRDIQRHVVYFKYPNVEQATIPDMSLGGRNWMVYGEYHLGKFYANPSTGTVAHNDTQKYQGAWIETDFNIKRDKLVGILRGDWFDPNADDTQDLDTIWGLTPALKWQILNQMYLTTSYELYTGKSGASSKGDDRITLELSTQF